ncbi:unnamed protein product [Agarophyton chilense]
MSNNRSRIAAFSQNGAPNSLTHVRVPSAGSSESFEINTGDETEKGAIAGVLERFNPTAAHRSCVLRKPGTKQSIWVDEIDEESVSMKTIPRGLIRGRSIGSIDVDDQDLMMLAQVRSASERSRSVYGAEDDEKQFLSNELGRRMYPEGFLRFRRVGPMPIDGKQRHKLAEERDTREVIDYKGRVDYGYTQEKDSEGGDCGYENKSDDYYEYDYNYYESDDEDACEGGGGSDVEKSTEAEEEKGEDAPKRQWSDDDLVSKLKHDRDADRVETGRFARRNRGEWGDYIGPWGSRSLFS